MSNTITIGSRTFVPTPPDPATCQGVLDYAVDNRVLTMAAALGLCWPGKPGRHGKPEARFRFNVLAYGQAVFNELFEAGYSSADIRSASLAAFLLCSDQLISDEEIEDAADFSEGPAGQPGGPASPSPEATARTSGRSVA